MTENDIKTICEKIDSLHAKILKSKFAETVTESEMIALIFAVEKLNCKQVEDVSDICVGNKWISVKDRLPERSGDYLTCRFGDIMSVLMYSAVHKLFNAYDDLSENHNKKFAVAVDYWMPLPEPPKEE